MGTVINNLEWMGINVLLALIPVILAYLVIKYHKKFISLIFFVLWFLFIPNTIYLITDLEYFSKDLLKTSGIYILILTFQYLALAIIGIITYFYAMKVAIKYFKNKYLIILFNFLIAFAVALGKIQRTESWSVFLHPAKTITDISKTINSPMLVSFVFLFGLFINIIFHSKEIYAKIRP